ncbi:MAG: uracil-DNA glycosylase [Dehalococcoidales bacterium]|nr:uracil-DNA glycosylase [Dehalococcoidales bacterium]
MKINEQIKCVDFPCTDTDNNSYVLPSVDIDAEKIRIVMITEAPPNDKADYFYAAGNPFYLQTTLQAFKDAGASAASMQDILDLGVYITTAVKCGKTQYAVSPDTMKNCSELLEKEIALFPNVKAFMLMGDVAIKMMNNIWKNQTGKKVIPAGSTYKIRGQAYYLGDKRVFPSYTPAGKNFLIEKSKRRMVAADIREAMKLI